MADGEQKVDQNGRREAESGPKWQMRGRKWTKMADEEQKVDQNCRQRGIKWTKMADEEQKVDQNERRGAASGPK